MEPLCPGADDVSGYQWLQRATVRACPKPMQPMRPPWVAPLTSPGGYGVSANPSGGTESSCKLFLLWPPQSLRPTLESILIIVHKLLKKLGWMDGLSCTAESTLCPIISAGNSQQSGGFLGEQVMQYYYGSNYRSNCQLSSNALYYLLLKRNLF